MKNKKVIVVQRHVESLIYIRKETEAISKKAAKSILFTQDPGEVVENVKHGEPVLVVSGQIFEEAGERSGIKYGTDLAWKVKGLNPKVLFFIYSTMPEYDFIIDGLIPKDSITLSSDGEMLLPAILLAYRKGMTAEDLKKIFPQIM